jgi:hypothetical protein
MIQVPKLKFSMISEAFQVQICVQGVNWAIQMAHSSYMGMICKCMKSILIIYHALEMHSKHP